MRDWYSPGALSHYGRNHIIWILANEELFYDGIYPREATSYTDSPGINAKHARTSRNAGFVQPTEVLAELMRRLARCGQDGELVIRVFVDGWEIDKLAKLLGYNEFAVMRKINQAIRYCRGRDAREADYKRFCNYERAMNRLAGATRGRGVSEMPWPDPGTM